MRQRRAAQNADPFTTVAKGGTRDRLKDAGSKELAQLAKKLGNDRVQGLIAGATGKRDALLDFIKERLARMGAAQKAEHQAMDKDRVWFDEVSRRKHGFSLPDPTRWRGPALLYKKAAEALCAGDLGRGAQLLDKAVEAERAAFDSMPVQVPLDAETKKPGRGPDEGAFVQSGEGCPTTHAPEVLTAADRIISVADRSPEQYVPRSAEQHRGWWDVEEDDDKKKDEKKEGAKKDGKAAERGAGASERGAVAAERDPERVEREPRRDEEVAKEDVAKDAGVAVVRAVNIGKPKKGKNERS